MKDLDKTENLSGVDLNLHRSFCDSASSWLVEAFDERRQICFCAADAAPSPFHFCSLCAVVRRRAQGQKLLVLGPISVHGRRTTDLSRKSARYRDLSQSTTLQALSLGFSNKHDLAQHAGQCQCHARLAHLCSVCAATHCHRAQAVCQRVLRSGSERKCLRVGLDFDRSLPFVVSLEPIAAIQSWGPTAYVARFAWPHPVVSVHQRSALCRDQCPGS